MVPEYLIQPIGEKVYFDCYHFEPVDFPLLGHAEVTTRYLPTYRQSLADHLDVMPCSNDPPPSPPPFTCNNRRFRMNVRHMSGECSIVEAEHLIESWFEGEPPMTTPYYTVCTPDNPLAQAQLHARRATYDAWRQCATIVGPIDATTRDWEEQAAALSSTMGTSAHRVEQHLLALYFLDRLPLLRALMEDMMHLDCYILTRMSDVLQRMDPRLDNDEKAWEFIDKEMTAFLTPKKPAQCLPSANNIVRKLQRTLLLLQDELPRRRSKSPEMDRNADFMSYANGPDTTGMIFSHDTAIATVIEDMVRQHAMAKNLTMAQAHADILLNQADVKVILNVYQAHDVADAPMFTADNTMLSKESEQLLSSLVTRTRSMDEAAESVTDSYHPTDAQRAYLEGRDGYCRWVGCNRKAKDCDKDHRINHEDGGKTTPSQMVSLCRQHHNRKTEQLVYYAFDHHTGNTYWLYQDGTWVVDEPQGPLAPANRRWLTSLGERLAKRRERMWNPVS